MEEREVNGLEAVQQIHIGDREVLLLHDPQSADTPWLVCYCTQIPGIGLDNPSEIIGGDDYLEAVEEFLNRAKGQIAQVRSNREISQEPQEVFGAAQCLPGGLEHSLQGVVVVIKPEILRPEYRNVASQLVYVFGGFGCSPNARGSAVFGYNVFNGEAYNTRKEHVLGVLDPKTAPSWVAKGMAAIKQQQKEKEGKSIDL